MRHGIERGCSSASRYAFPSPIKCEICRASLSYLGRALRQRDPSEGKRQALEFEVHKVVEIIDKGLLSPGLAARLQTAERKHKSLPAASDHQESA